MGVVPPASEVEVQLEDDGDWVRGYVEEFDSNTGEYIVTMASDGEKQRVPLARMREVVQE